MAGVEKLVVYGMGPARPMDCKYLKGWSRATCLLYVLDVISKSPPHVMASVPKDILDTYSAVFVVVNVTASSVEEKLQVSREITMASCSLRVRPNAFTHLYQVKMMVQASGSDAEAALSRWSEVSEVSKLLAISQEEARAAANLAVKMPGEVVQVLQNAVQKHGFQKGPVSQALLASPVICLGYAPAHADPAYREGLKNGPEALMMLAERCAYGLDSNSMPIPSKFEASPH